MKSFIVFLFFVAISAAQVQRDTKNTEIYEKFVKIAVEKLIKSLEAKGNDQGITAELNEYAEKLLSYVAKYAVNHDLEPIAITDIAQDFLLANFKLTQSELRGISTIERYDDVFVSYKHNTKVLSLIIPIEFIDLSFMYHYEIHVLGMGPIGELIGDIKQFKFYLSFDFDIPNLKASINKLEVTDCGQISVTASGNPGDFIFNLISEFVTTILHPLIQGIIEVIIKNAATQVVKDINELLYNITHPTNSTINQISSQYSQYILDYKV
ncbi:unnamed protein product [Diabrotica balteata]|uniref:Uncharacterized protein n=1 Tax=Diabrotica balteata TaxID=107213 RepID=A0A9N9SUX9_DIABA|nr:unnamed protein product [Diabrotica balteata]